MDGEEEILLLDNGYLLTTPDILHLLGRIVKDVYYCLEICVKFGQKRGRPSKWGIAGDRIASQWKFRPNDGRNVATFPKARCSPRMHCQALRHDCVLGVASISILNSNIEF